MKIGAVPVPINTAERPAELAYMLGDCRARAVVTDAALPEGDRTTLRSDDLAAGSPDLETFATGVDEPCYWLYSSGTTGNPKGVVHLHGDMLACVTPYAEEVVGMEPEDVTFSVARLFFSYGLVNSLFLPLLAGASAVLTPQRPDVGHILEVVRGFRPTLFFSVPTSYAQLCAAGDTTAFASVRLAISAGEPLPEPLYTRWKSLTNVEVLDGLGSTEVGYIYCSNLPGAVKPGSSGRMLGDHRARVVDERGWDVPDGESGELWVSAASTALHYWNQRERTKHAFVGEWLRSGDRYIRDVDGYLWYQGRIDDVFKVSGQWVSPLEVESCLLQHPSVLECAVVSATDKDGLVKPKAFVVPRPAAMIDVTALQTFVRERLQPHKYPRWVEIVDELPKTASGKVQRFVLRER
jgi:benzoate-CoA ligase family protein